MYNRIIRMVADRHQAEDILQEVFLKVFRYLPNFKGDSTIGAWIKRIAINTTIEHLRSNRRIEYVDSVPENGILHPAIGEASPKVSMATIHEAIKQLPSGSRVVLTLYLLEGYQHQEIAQILDISASTSKTQYRRGRQLLQEILKEKLRDL
jgi:RNA polymerase sigma-70 factor (ECF subfamily)